MISQHKTYRYTNGKGEHSSVRPTGKRVTAKSSILGIGLDVDEFEVIEEDTPSDLPRKRLWVQEKDLLEIIEEENAPVAASCPKVYQQDMETQSFWDK